MKYNGKPIVRVWCLRVRTLKKQSLLLLKMVQEILWKRMVKQSWSRKRRKRNQWNVTRECNAGWYFWKDHVFNIAMWFSDAFENRWKSLNKEWALEERRVNKIHSKGEKQHVCWYQRMIKKEKQVCINVFWNKFNHVIDFM